MVAIALIIFGIIDPDYFVEIDPATEFIVSIILAFLYYFIFESIWQRTPGKFITGTKVVDINGRKPSPGMIAKRTLIRFIPFEAFSFIGKKAYGWHDRWSRTYVIEAKRFSRKKFRTDMREVTTDNLEKETVVSENLTKRSSTEIDPNLNKNAQMTLVSPETDKDQKHGLIKRTAIHNNETVESDKRAMLDSELDTQGILLGKVEQCANCEETIGRLEKSYEFKGRIVCSQCYKRLV